MVLALFFKSKILTSKKALFGLCVAKRRILFDPSCMRLFYLMLLKFCKDFKRNQIEDFKKEVMVLRIKTKAQQIFDLKRKEQYAQ